MPKSATRLALKGDAMRVVYALAAAVLLTLVAPTQASAAGIPLTPPTATSTWVDQLSAKTSGDRYVLQQWEDDINNDFVLRIAAATGNTTLGKFEDLSPLYRGQKRIKPEYEMWSFYGPDSFSPGFRTVAEGDLVSGLTLTMPRFKWRDGDYTIAFIEEDSRIPQWRCSIYYYDVCYWDTGGSRFDYKAALFTMQDGRAVDFEMKSDFFVSGKTMDKRFKRWTRR